MMNEATCKQVGGSCLLHYYKRFCSMKHSCANMLLLVVSNSYSFHIIFNILNMVHIQQLHLFKNEATNFFFFGNSKFAMASQNLLPSLLVMLIGVVECDASPFYIE